MLRHNIVVPHVLAIQYADGSVKTIMDAKSLGSVQRIKCDYQGCTKSYAELSELTRHKKISHKNTWCQICGTKCTLATTLKRHMKRSHGVDVSTDLAIRYADGEVETIMKDDSAAERTEVPYKGCQRDNLLDRYSDNACCTKSFTTQRVYKQHAARDCKEETTNMPSRQCTTGTMDTLSKGHQFDEQLSSLHAHSGTRATTRPKEAPGYSPSSVHAFHSQFPTGPKLSKGPPRDLGGKGSKHSSIFSRSPFVDLAGNKKVL